MEVRKNKKGQKLRVKLEKSDVRATDRSSSIKKTAAMGVAIRDIAGGYGR